MNTPNHANPDTNPNGFDDGTQNNPESVENQKKTPALDDMTKEELAEKFKASAKGAQDLLRANKERDARIAELQAQLDAANNTDNPSDTIYEGFEHLPEDERNNVVGLANAIKTQATSEMMQHPAFKEHEARANELKFDTAFNMVAAAYPDLLDHKEGFKAQYFQPNNVPDNIESLLTDLAKVYLFDNAKEIGKQEGIKNAHHVDDALRTDGGSGGENQTITHKSLQEWETLARTNPSEFSSPAMQKKYNEDMQSGKL